jgi:hypothetical protein
MKTGIAVGWMMWAMLVLHGAVAWANCSTYYGSNAGDVDTDANCSTFVGSVAGTANFFGAYNVFLGYAAGVDNVSGYQNSFVGTFAGYHNVNAINNTFVGYSAGYHRSSGDNDTFVGVNAGFNSVGDKNTFIGSGAGYGTAAGSTGYYNTFVGSDTGPAITSGQFDTFLGTFAGYQNTTGSFNTYLGAQTGEGNTSGDGNVFVGNAAGYTETGSNKLYIDTCQDGPPCANPLIYGEFDNNLLKVNGVLNVRANGLPKSQMHFSRHDTDTGGWITSVLDNNFFLSSGTSFDANAGNWTQRSPDNSAVIAGSGSLGYRIFANSGNTVGVTFTPTVRLHIDYAGNLGLNQAAVAGTPIQHSSGAHLTSGGVWTDASSREYKEHITSLTTEEAMQALAALDPVKYNYKSDIEEKHVGFIAEDVPELVATKDRRSLSPMDIVAVLTKVTQQKNQALDEQKRTIARQQEELMQLKDQLASLAERTQRLEQSSAAASR